MKFFWQLYSVLFLTIVLGNTLQLLDKNSSIAIYYNITIIFSSWFVIPYFLNILSVLINCIVGVFIIGYAFEISGMVKIPQWLFYVRLLIDCVGHSYEMKAVQSGLSHGNILDFIRLASMIPPILPSYIAQWRMTFKP